MTFIITTISVIHLLFLIFLAKELKIDTKRMPRQALLSRVFLLMDMTTVVCTIAPGYLWSQNIFHINAYIYFLGMNPGRFVYDAIIFIWIYVSWITNFHFVSINFVYLISAYTWIEEIL